MDDASYCTMEPDFPETAYVCGLFFSVESRLLLLPQETIYTSKKHAMGEVRKFTHTVLQSHPKTAFVQSCIFLPITFDRRVPLKPEYWKNPTVDFGVMTKITQFAQFYQHPGLFTLLVTPSSYDETSDTWTLCPAIPLKLTNTDKTIEQFMLHSKHPVDHRAKSAAIYTPGTPMVLDWKTGKLTRPVGIRGTRTVN